MTDVEILAVIRGVMAAVGLVFAVRARMWFLTAALFCGVIASVCLATGLALVVSGIVGMPLYGALVIHTLLVTRVRRTEPYLPWRRS